VKEDPVLGKLKRRLDPEAVAVLDTIWIDDDSFDFFILVVRTMSEPKSKKARASSGMWTPFATVRRRHKELRSIREKESTYIIVVR
jgi:hypothetical protein